MKKHLDEYGRVLKELNARGFSHADVAGSCLNCRRPLDDHADLPGYTRMSIDDCPGPKCLFEPTFYERFGSARADRLSTTKHNQLLLLLSAGKNGASISTKKRKKR